MRFTMGLALVAALGAAACKKKPNATTETGSGSGSASGAAAVVPIDAAPAVWRVPAGAHAADANADATSLGTAVTVHLVEHVAKDVVGGGRGVTTLVVLEGSGNAIAADETSEGFAQDGAASTMAIQGEADIVLSPLTPPRPFAEADSIVPLDFKGPLLFLAHFQSKGEKRDLAIARDKDTLAVWTMIAPSDAVDVAPSWEQTGTIKLAPGAVVTTPAVVGTATPPAPAPAGASGALSPTALDDALAAKGVKHDDVLKRADQPHSQWAVVTGKLVGGVNATSYIVWRATSGGTSTLELTLPAGANFDDVLGIDVQDVDKDGVDDAVIATKWERSLDQPAGKGHTLQTTEHVEQVHVVGGAKLALGAQHVRDYKTESNLGPEENAQPEESVALTVNVAAGPPPVLHATVGATNLQPKRIKGLLGLQDPLLAAGDSPIAFK